MPTLFPLTLAATLCLILAPSPRRVAPVQCTGCMGIGGAASASGGNCGGLVTVTVTVANGNCKVLMGEEPGDILCRSSRSCMPTVLRTWSGLTPNTELDFCVQLHGEELCLQPKPTSGAGSGSDTRASASMTCTDDPAATRSFSIKSPSCGLFASAEGRCSACDDL